MSYSKLREVMHNKQLKLRNAFRLIDDLDFMTWFNKQTNQDEIIKDISEGVYEKYLSKSPLRSELALLSVRALRDVASQYKIPLYTRMGREELIEEIENVKKANKP